MENKTLVIGIAGGTGSGKTTITRRIQRRFGHKVSTLYHDNYYKRHDELTYEERAALNYDCPEAFDTDLMITHLEKLRRGEAVHSPTYDYTAHNRSDRTVTIYPAPIVLVEGILILENEALCRAMDIKVFVDTDADVRILRRVVRDVRDRGRSLESVVNQYLTTVKPMHEKYVEPSRRRADVIIPEGGHNGVALNLLMDSIQVHLKGNRNG